MTTELWQRIERAIVLNLLDHDHPKPWEVCELEAAISDFESLAVRHSIGELEDNGVAVVEGRQVWASACSRRLDDLGLIAV
jgi:hypothetical protein